MRKAITLWICLFLVIFAADTGLAVEPNMADYSAVPLFSNQSVAPNVMIMLDNSGSMNFNAYGTWAGDDQVVTDQPFAGKPYDAILSFPVVTGQDDAEEKVAVGSVLYYNDLDLDLGGFSVGSNDSIVGIRIQNIQIPQGATILNAYFEFNANASESTASNFLIEGEASDNALPFSTVADDLKNRTATAATFAWNNVPAWTNGQFYVTPDITPIVQEIVNRPGWTIGNSMVFRFTGTGKRDLRPFDRDSSRAPTLHVVVSGNASNKRYYGLFSPDHFYNYSSGQFNLAYKKVDYDYTNQRWEVKDLNGTSGYLTDAEIVSKKLWDGNWLNWLCMRRVDVLKKVLMGGKASTRDGSGNQTAYGEIPIQGGRDFHKVFDSSSLSATSPYDGNYTYRMHDGYIIVDSNQSGSFTNSDDDFRIQIGKDADHEPNDFLDGNLAGVLQRVGTRARWGNIWFNDGEGTGQEGGTVEHVMGTDVNSLIADLQDKRMDTWTPLAESFYVAMQYFKQEDPEAGWGYDSNAVPHGSNSDDPYYNGAQFVECAKSFVILLTDGASTRDARVPTQFRDTDGDGDDTTCSDTNCEYSSGGSDYLDDLTLYARTTDLRSDLDGNQNIIFYAIHAFDRDPNATSLLMDAARNGGFDDMDNNDVPNLPQEYDRDNDGLPDTFFEADDGFAIENKLLAAITDILKRTSSGTAASVLATNSTGEGNLLQAYYLPYSSQGLEEAQWYGFVQSLWIDSYGLLYEDSNQNLTFDSGDEQISFTTDADNDTAFIRNGMTIKLNESDPALKLKPIFEIGDRLSKKNPATRNIFTYIDKDNDGVVDESTTYDAFDNTGELFAFTTTASSTIKPYLGVHDDTVYGDNGAKLGSTHADRTTNIITWVRGTDVPGLRNRTLNTVTWPLGDIIHSTPVTVSRPVERFHLWYADTTYRDFYDRYKDREAVTYLGSNDGMLHAFAGWKYDVGLKQYLKPASAPADEEIGDELWAFIPQSVLPHLKWPANEDYSHTYLVDAKPRIFDAKIIADGTHYSDSDGDDDWGTILVMGLNMGAKKINVENFDDGSGAVAREFNPTFVCMDITEPRLPRLLWERSYPNSGLTTSTPIPVKVGDKWFLVFGSGPDDYDGRSTQPGYIFVVDMKTGDLLRQFGPYDDQAFFGTAASIDKNLNYNVDAIYIGNTYWDTGLNTWRGGLYKIAIPCSNCQWDTNYNPSADFGYDEDPANWTAHKLFASDRPITAAPSISVETFPSLGVDNVWVYFGTGRFLENNDRITTDQEYLYGVKDPFFNHMYKTTSQYDYAASAGITLNRASLFPADTVVTTTNGVVLDVQGVPTLYNGTGYFNDLVDDIRANYDGWFRKLDTNGSAPSERMISKPAIFGGIAFFATFTPSTDICENDGTTNLYVPYYITGTGYTKQILDILNPDTIDYTYYGQTVTEEVVAVKLKTALIGAPPPSVGLHTGKEEGAKAFIQLSTGVVELLDVNSALYMKSAITDWWDRTD